MPEPAAKPEDSGGFLIPEWDAPIDLDAYLKGAPANGTAKGMFFQSFVTTARKAAGKSPGRERYVAFKDYPVQEYLEVLFECARLVFPGEPHRQALRLLGRTVYPTLMESLIGRVLFTFARNDVKLALGAVPKAYSILAPVSSAEVVDLEGPNAIVKLRNVWDVVDACQVGVFEGGLEALRHSGEVRVRLLSLCDADFRIRWS